MKIKVIKQKSDWDKFLGCVEFYDFYHTFDYHQLSKKDDEESVLITYEEDEALIGLPLIVRKIKGTDYLDATSVYGYSGPICNDISENFNFGNYQSALKSHFLTNKIISVFARLHPFSAIQNMALKDFGDLSYLGKVVNINLTLELDEQRRKYKKSLKTRVNKAKRMLSLKVASTPEDFKTFIDIYYENMERLNAKNFYYFSEEYFHEFLMSDDFKTDVLIAIDNETGEAVAASMFVKTKDIVQYHLSGSVTKHLYLNGMKFLLDHMRVQASDEGFKYFNLGGGLGASDDSLFMFKSSFSDEHHPFYIWKLVIDEVAYNQVCEKNGITQNDSSYFPLYRLNENI